MQNVIYTPKLTDQLQIIHKCASLTATVVADKSLEQFLAEIKMLKELLDETGDLARLSIQREQ